jgi:hypothetical protein
VSDCTLADSGVLDTEGLGPWCNPSIDPKILNAESSSDSWLGYFADKAASIVKATTILTCVKAGEAAAVAALSVGSFAGGVISAHKAGFNSVTSLFFGALTGGAATINGMEVAQETGRVAGRKFGLGVCGAAENGISMAGIMILNYLQKQKIKHRIAKNEISSDDVELAENSVSIRESVILDIKVETINAKRAAGFFEKDCFKVDFVTMAVAA